MVITLPTTEVQMKVSWVQDPPLRVSVGLRVSSTGISMMMKPPFGIELAVMKTSVYLELMPEVTGSEIMMDLPVTVPEVGVKDVYETPKSTRSPLM